MVLSEGQSPSRSVYERILAICANWTELPLMKQIYAVFLTLAWREVVTYNLSRTAMVKHKVRVFNWVAWRDILPWRSRDTRDNKDELGFGLGHGTRQEWSYVLACRDKS